MQSTASAEPATVDTSSVPQCTSTLYVCSRALTMLAAASSVFRMLSPVKGGPPPAAAGISNKGTLRALAQKPRLTTAMHAHILLQARL
ncbi:hypothetical protein EON66_04910 [archaeon]|nr:MAG: hypothetical protein EON66_04910 [archaeon]